MTVAENFLLGRSRGVVGRSRLHSMGEEIAALAGDTGLACTPDARVETLSVGEQQRVEILRPCTWGPATCSSTNRPRILHLQRYIHFSHRYGVSRPISVSESC